jgi:hypothetical protein
MVCVFGIMLEMFVAGGCVFASAVQVAYGKLDLYLSVVFSIAELLCEKDYVPLNIDRINQRTAQKTEKSRRKLETGRFVAGFSEMLLFLKYFFLQGSRL